jgi:hypothetical protein
MGSIDLALYADGLAAEAAALSARLERLRGELRRAAIEREARLALAPDLVVRLERLGLLGAGQPGSLGDEIAELQVSLLAVRALQVWVEARLARCEAADGEPSRRDPGARADGDEEPAQGTPDSHAKEAAMTA